MTYKADSTPLSARTNSDFNATVTLDYNIQNLTVLFKVKKSTGQIIDLSSYTFNSDQSIIIGVPSNIMATIGSGKVLYDVVIDNGSGSKDMIIGGYITIEEGIS